MLAALSLLCISSSAFTAGSAPRARRPGLRAAAPARDTLPLAIAPYDSTLGDSLSEGQLFMAWHAPYGMPGARSDLAFTCDDTSRVDTLYLSFETGRELPQFVALFGRLYLHPAFGESLGTHWRYGRGDPNNGGLLIQMDPDGTFPCSQPWLRPGMGAPRYEFAPSLGELQIIYAIPLGEGGPVKADQRYCFARLLFKRWRCQLAGARQPLCIEWFEGQYSGGGRDLGITHGSGRFVSINSPDGSVCTPYRRTHKPPLWQPPLPVAPPATVPPAPRDTVVRDPG
jgi:hypothetical protein